MAIRHERWPTILALAAHELRTPAGVVSGYTRMLLLGRVGELAGPQRAALEAADRSNARLAALLAQMSDLAHLEDGTLRLTPSPVDLAAFLTSSGDAAPMPAPIPPLPAPSLRLDAARVRGALAALAALHRRKGVPEPALAARVDAEALWLAVGAADVAAGALPARRDSLQPFDDLQGGLGLDLVLARVVIEGHRGTILTRTHAEPACEVTVIRLPLAEAP